MKERKTILIADDSELIRKILSELLSEEYEVVTADDGAAAIALIEENPQRFCILLLDLVMPHTDGFQVLAYLRRTDLISTLPVLFITAEESECYIGLAYDLGASEVIQKPFNRSIIKKRIRNIVDLYSQKKELSSQVERQTESLRQQANELMRTNTTMIDTLSTVIEYRSLESGQHIRRMRGLTGILAQSIAEREPQRLPLSEVDIISSASALHDVGKIAIPDSVLLKPGKLTEEEFEIMKKHTVVGSEIIFRLYGISDERYLAYCHQICLYHHERWDGRGYPDGLQGDEIPLAAQITAVADVFDALTHKRVYKDAYPIEQARDMILQGECGAFSPLMCRAFVDSFGQFGELFATYQDS